MNDLKATALTIIGCAIAGAAIYGVILSQPARTLKRNVVSVQYSNDYIIANMRDGVYERYEHKDYDGSNSCTQLVEYQEHYVYVDNAQGLCDGITDFIVDSGNVHDYWADREIENFKGRNAIEELLRIWDREKRKCNKQCKLTLE